MDIETSKKPNHFPWLSDSYCASVGIVYENGDKYSWLLEHDESRGLPDKKLWEIQDHFREPKLIVAHNLKFDLNWIKWLGINLEGCKLFCTQVADYLLNGQQRVGYTLDAVAKRWGIQSKIDKVSLFWESGYRTREIPANVLLPYMEQDCFNTLAIYQRQAKELKRKGLIKLMKLYMANLDMLSDAEITGLRTSKEKAERFIKEFKNEIETIDKRLEEIFGRSFNIDSNDQLSVLLFGGKLFVEGREYTKVKLKSGEVKYRGRKTKIPLTIKGVGLTPPKGSEVKKSTKDAPLYSTSKDTLAQIKPKNKKQKEVLDLLNRRSAIHKTLTTFESGAEGEKGLINMICEDDCIHPSFNQTVAITGRLSSSNPNGQNWSKKETNPVKQIFIPRNGGILNVDLSQLEFRVAAALSWDELMIQEINDGLDIHLDNAIRFFGDEKYRTTAKIMTFRILQSEASRSNPCRRTGLIQGTP